MLFWLAVGSFFWFPPISRICLCLGASACFVVSTWFASFVCGMVFFDMARLKSLGWLKCKRGETFSLNFPRAEVSAGDPNPRILWLVMRLFGCQSPSFSFLPFRLLTATLNDLFSQFHPLFPKQSHTTKPTPSITTMSPKPSFKKTDHLPL